MPTPEDINEFDVLTSQTFDPTLIVLIVVLALQLFGRLHLLKASKEYFNVSAL
ncbi:MAG: hypothetical protein IT279_04000 [Ignavibacteriaceae bacterium]|nr:hypothetical protein [Ignavibacteriaceae bacterium]